MTDPQHPDASASLIARAQLEQRAMFAAALRKETDPAVRKVLEDLSTGRITPRAALASAGGQSILARGEKRAQEDRERLAEIYGEALAARRQARQRTT